MSPMDPQPPKMDRQPAVSVVAVTYNSGPVLAGMLDSLRSGLDDIGAFSVVVADNASSDGSGAMVTQHAIGARLVQMGRNAGYSAAINAAIATVPEDNYVLILNPDIRLLAKSVKPLLDAFRDPAIGVTVPRILNEDGSLALSLRRMPSIATAWAEAVLGGSLAKKLGLSEIVEKSAIYETGGAVDWATGAALLVSPEARRRVGTWDEWFFLYSEEVDFLERVRRSGLQVIHVPQAQMIHIGGDYRVRPWLSALLTANRVLYYRRHHGTVKSFLFKAGVVVGKAIRSPLGAAHRAAFKASLLPSSIPRSPDMPRGKSNI